MKKNIIGIILIAILSIAGQSVHSQITHVVSNTNDSGPGSLRATIAAARDRDNIRFNPNLISSKSDTILLSSEISFTKGLNIVGLYNATDTLFISGNNTTRIFFVNCGSVNNGTLTLDSLVLINGRASSLQGGAVKFDEGKKMTIKNCVVRKCYSAGGGGGISAGSSVSDPSMEIINSHISNNTTPLEGGGVSLTSYNSSTSITISNSTVSNNTSQNRGGGGVYCRSSKSLASVFITNSTIANNSTFTEGGGIFCNAYASNPTVKVTNSTFFNNWSVSTRGKGSAISAVSNASSGSISAVEVKGSIISSDSKARNNIDMWPGDSITSKGFNIFSHAPKGTVATDSINVSVSSLKLGSLKNNGSGALTMMPMRGSMAVNSGDPNDHSKAQNGALEGTRDRGAAEMYCSSSQIAITVSVNGATLSSDSTGRSYQWVECDNGYAAISGATQISYTPSKNGNYAVIVNDGICDDTSKCTQVSNVGIYNRNFNTQNAIAKVYPNPTNGFITIELIKLEKARIHVYNVIGEHIANFETNTLKTKFRLKNEKGLYFIHIQTNDVIETFRIIKQ